MVVAVLTNGASKDTQRNLPGSLNYDGDMPIIHRIARFVMRNVVWAGLV